MPSANATTSDVELVDLAHGGNRAAFGELLHRHDDRMRTLAFRLLADRAAMDTALVVAYRRAYEGLPELPPGSDFGRWLYRITYNASVDEIRRRKRSDEDDDGDGPAEVSRPANLSTGEVVRHALSELPAAQRVTVVLVDGEGFDQETVSDILGVAPGTVASRLFRARTRLRRALWDEIG